MRSSKNNVSAFAIYFTVGYVTLRHGLLKIAKPLDDETTQWKARVKHRSLTLYSAEGTRSPFICGLIAPHIVLPDWCLDLSAEEQRMIIEHELDHVRHFDVLKKALGTCACCVFWFNPMVWLLRTQMASTIEMACDEAATKTGDRREYAMLLLQVATRPKTRFSAAFSEGDLKVRIKNLTKTAGKSLILDIVLVLLLGASFVCYAESGQLDPTQLGKQAITGIVLEEGAPVPEIENRVPKERFLLFGNGGYHIIEGSETIIYSNIFYQGWKKNSGDELHVEAEVISSFVEGQIVKIILIDTETGKICSSYTERVTDSLSVTINISETSRYKLALICCSSDQIAVNSIHIY